MSVACEAVEHVDLKHTRNALLELVIVVPFFSQSAAAMSSNMTTALITVSTRKSGHRPRRSQDQNTRNPQERR